jgi:LmbE family N-acetylglucosaminyl deacetylase
MRVLVVAAHPDDETIGASTLLDDAVVIHVTDGAPRDSRWWPDGVIDRDAYARLRAHEAERALAHVRAKRIAFDIVDQEAIYDLPHLEAAIAREIELHRPDVIVTHAYEGGHPDNDAVALAVARAVRTVRRPPPVYEMALYHGARGALVAGEFVDDTPHHVLDHHAQRSEMLECFESQQATLDPFRDVEYERYRLAPAYDFAAPPHAGLLLYEQLGFAMTGAEWRARVK